MKVRTLFLLLIIALIDLGCDDFPGNYPEPVFLTYGIYKTKGDYFHYYSTWLGRDGSINHFLDVDLDETIVNQFDGYEGYHLRVRLDNGYFLGGEITSKDVFTDVTFKEYYDVYSSQGLGVLDSLLESRIIDEDPFEAYYSIPEDELYEFIDSIPGRDTLNTKEFRFRELVQAAKEIDKIIAAGTLDEHFKKLK